MGITKMRGVLNIIGNMGQLRAIMDNKLSMNHWKLRISIIRRHIHQSLQNAI